MAHTFCEGAQRWAQGSLCLQTVDIGDSELLLCTTLAASWVPQANGCVSLLIKDDSDAPGILDVCKSEKFNYMCH